MNDALRRKLLDLAATLLLGGAAFALYARTLAPTVLAGDGGEFQFAPYLLGVAHPTGYPLYCLLGGAWSRLLSLGDVAYRMNLFSALWAALAVAFFYPLARALLRQAFPPASGEATREGLSPGVRRLIAVLAAAAFAVTPTFWSQAIIAEVYTLHIFFVVLLFYLLLTLADHDHWGESSAPARPGWKIQPPLDRDPLPARRADPTAWRQRGRTPNLLLAASCILFGLSLTHHRTTLLLVPALLAYLWRQVAKEPRSKRNLLLATCCLLLAVSLPLLLYLYIPLRAPHTPYLRLPLAEGRELTLYENTPANFVNFVLGGPFGGAVDLSVDLGARLAMAGGFFQREVAWIGLALALVGLGYLAARRRWALLALTGLTFLATVAFNLVYTIGDIFVLYIPAYLVVVLWMAVAVGALCQFTKSPIRQFAILASFALPLWLGFAHYADVDQSRNTRARARWEAILAEPLPPDAVLVSDNRNNIMPLWYFQYVDGVRPDLLGLFPLITPEYPTLGQVLDLALSTGRPVYLIKEMPGLEVKVRTVRKGRLWRVLGPAVEGEPDYPRQARLADAVALVGYDRLPRSPRPGEALQVSLYWEALRPLGTEYHTFVHLVDAAGETAAQSDRQPGGVYYPTTLWQPGERLRDDHTLDLLADTPPGVYHLLAGMYALADDGTLEPLGEPVSLGPVAVKADALTEAGDVGQPVGAEFGGQIELLGYRAARQGDMLLVTLHWRCLQPPAADYTVFVHLLDADGATVAQHDGQPQGGGYPTSVWDSGEVVADEHPLPLPPGFSADGYRLRVGLYLLETGERLPVAGGGDSIELKSDQN